jgi:transcriptional regulator with PAS, ATPase and Fis domain
MIAAQSKNLDAMVEAGSFRRHLYYRIHVMSLVLTPLRERKGDIPLLADYFMQLFSEQHQEEKVKLSKWEEV